MSEGKHKRYFSRFEEVMAHTTRYAFEGRARLADDCGISRMSVGRLLSGAHNPSYRLVDLVAKTLGRELGLHLDPSELISYDDTYERSVCQVCRCRGCLPDGALGNDGLLTEPYLHVKPGTWMTFLRDRKRASHQS